MVKISKESIIFELDDLQKACINKIKKILEIFQIEQKN